MEFTDTANNIFAFIGYACVFLVIAFFVFMYFITREADEDPDFNPMDELYKEQERHRQTKERLDEINKAANNLEYELREKTKELEELKAWRDQVNQYVKVKV